MFRKASTDAKGRATIQGMTTNHPGIFRVTKAGYLPELVAPTVGTVAQPGVVTATPCKK